MSEIEGKRGQMEKQISKILPIKIEKRARKRQIMKEKERESEIARGSEKERRKDRERMQGKKK